MTEETLGTSEKTELDAHFEHLAERANATKTWTEKILKDMEAMLTPNPGKIWRLIVITNEKSILLKLTNLLIFFYICLSIF